MNAVKKAEQEVIKEQKKQLRIINVVCFVTLYRMGWDADKIIQRFNDATDVWNECKQKHISTFELLEEETDIEMALDDEKSYHEFSQLQFTERVVTTYEYIYSLNRRKRWIAPMILATIAVALHRVDQWDEDELAEFIGITNALRQEYGDHIEQYVAMMKQETGYTPKLWGE